MDKQNPIKLYNNKKKSVREISETLECSQNKINYWLEKYAIKKRTIAEAVYIHHNPNGDPFSFHKLKTKEDALLFGLGMGLYWSEGTKRDTHAVRLGNSDPYLIKKFMQFLIYIYGVKKDDLRFGLQIFDDMSSVLTKKFWKKHLDVRENQFYKVMYKTKGGKETYGRKCQYGVLTLYFNNKKLRDIICENIKNLYN